LAAVPAAFLTIGAIFLPETPSFIIQRDGNIHQAKILLQRLRGTTGIQKELDDLVSASNVKDNYVRKVISGLGKPIRSAP
jgi:MFS transporter, SP family, sugar:H+ symporter